MSVRVGMLFNAKVNESRWVELRHNAPVLDCETLESEQKHEEAREISYNADTIRTMNALAVVMPKIDDFIYTQGQALKFSTSHGDDVPTTSVMMT